MATLPQDLASFFVPDNIEKELGPYYVSKHVLGRGASSEVKLAWHKANRTPAAVKIVAKYKLTDRARDNLERELQIHSFISKFNHKNICGLHEAIETGQHYYIFLDYVPDGDLVDYIEASTRIPEAEAKVLFRQIMEAISFLHGHSIVHRDIKAENFLVQKRHDQPLTNGSAAPVAPVAAGTNSQVNGITAGATNPDAPAPHHTPPLLKLTDFGLADWIQSSKSFNTPCGSPVYTAPEVVEKKSYKGEPTDIWSAGILLYTMLAGEFPFSHPNLLGLFDQIRRGQYSFPVDISGEAKDLISRILARDAGSRLSVEQILDHPWLSQPFQQAPSSKLPPGWI